ncbi:MAG: hypothetical protein Q9191_005915 [Dirinaria sp. TL-2023a]
MRPNLVFFAALATAADALTVPGLPNVGLPSVPVSLPVPVPTSSLGLPPLPPVSLPTSSLPIPIPGGLPVSTGLPLPGGLPSVPGVPSVPNVPTDPTALLGNISQAISLLQLITNLLQSQGLQIPGVGGIGVGSALVNALLGAVATLLKNPYEVTTEDKVAAAAENAPPAQISLTDCLACSGCVTSAEAVLVSLQSHTEVLNALDTYPGLDPSNPRSGYVDTATQTADEGVGLLPDEGKLFIASVSPQVRASIAATYSITEAQAGNLITQLLSGSQGLASSGGHKNGFAWTIDTNAMREACLVLAADEVLSDQSSGTCAPSDQAGSFATAPEKPILTSACPGWICYAEKTHAHTIPHLSRLKSPQALTGTLLKTVLSRRMGIRPDQIWHLAVMPCFDKKLEASREELTDVFWRPPGSEESSIHNSLHSGGPVRDTDCVITARELVMLADTRGISLPSLPLTPLPHRRPFPDPTLEPFLFPPTTARRSHISPQKGPEAGTSGGYLHHILCTKLALHPGSTLHTSRGRNADVIDFSILSPDSSTPLFKAARYYGSRNITNLVRKLRPAGSRMPVGAGVARKAASSRGSETRAGGTGLDYVEVMACPGGCTNGGGQIKAADTGTDISSSNPVSQKEWLAKVDEAYFSASDEDVPPPPSSSSSSDLQSDAEGETIINGISPSQIRWVLNYWSESTGIPLQKLVCTGYRAVQSDVGKKAGGGGREQQERVVELAGRIGGGW